MRIPDDLPTRYFTPAEANAALAELRPMLQRAVELGRELRAAMQRVSQVGTRTREELETARRRVESLRGEAARAVAELRGLGVEVKGLDEGLVDFPALRNGERVLLCFKLDEKSVEWWHPRSTGFAGRRRVDETPKASWEWRN